jgi:hypothetical protein
MPILGMRDGMVQEYLAKLHQTIENAFKQHSKVFALRVDLNFPVGTPQEVVHGAIKRFNEALKYQLEAINKIRNKSGRLPHKASYRVVWARERVGSDLPHFHCLILTNGNAIQSAGQYEMGSGSLYDCIVWAWNSALHLPNETSYVNFSRGGEYLIQRGQRYDDLFEAGSYLCKVYSKEFSAYGNSFGYTRR